MPLLRHGDLEIHYIIDGSGPWLTMVHGFSQDLHLWDAQVERLSGAFRILRVDLRGHGGSSATSSGYGPAEYASDVLAVLDARSIGATHFWGTHTGAGVGLLLAANEPERIATLVLEGAVIPGVPVAIVEEWHGRARQIARRDGVVVAIRDWFDHGPFFEPIRRDPIARRADAHRTIVERFSGAPWLATGPALPVPDLQGRLASIRQRTLIVNGSDDLPEFLATAERLERELPNATHVIVPGAGAFPAWEMPAAVTPLVAQFLDEVD